MSFGGLHDFFPHFRYNDDDDNDYSDGTQYKNIRLSARVPFIIYEKENNRNSAKKVKCDVRERYPLARVKKKELFLGLLCDGNDNDINKQLFLHWQAITENDNSFCSKHVE